jgi:membrane protein YdbS with pleckstrin-like domain
VGVSPSNNLPGGAVAGIAIAVGLIVFSVAIIISCFFYKRLTQNIVRTQELDMTEGRLMRENEVTVPSGRLEADTVSNGDKIGPVAGNNGAERSIS